MAVSVVGQLSVPTLSTVISVYNFLVFFFKKKKRKKKKKKKKTTKKLYTLIV